MKRGSSKICGDAARRVRNSETLEASQNANVKQNPNLSASDRSGFCLTFAWWGWVGECGWVGGGAPRSLPSRMEKVSG